MTTLRGSLAKAAAFVAASGKMTVYQALNWIYDNPLWIAAEIAFGKWGVLAMAVGAIIINFCVLKYYQRKKVSWLMWDKGVDYLKRDLRKLLLQIMLIVGVVLYVFSDSLLGLFIPISLTGIPLLVILAALKSRKVESILMFILLSFYQDSFITTAYLRHGRCDGIRKRDMAIFLASSVISILYWAARNGFIAEVVVRPLF